jgi:hypothetical protein
VRSVTVDTDLIADIGTHSGASGLSHRSNAPASSPAKTGVDEAKQIAVNAAATSRFMISSSDSIASGNFQPQ